MLPALAPDEQLAGLLDAVVIAIPFAAHAELIAFPEAAELLVDSLLEALSERQESLANANWGPHAERLRRKLYQLARIHGSVSNEGIELELPLTHQLLAQMIGSARETVTIALTRFQRDGMLVRTRGGFRLTVVPATLERPSQRRGQ